MIYILASHVFFIEDKKDIYGSVHMLEDFLIENKKNYIYIKHGLNKNLTIKKECPNDCVEIKTYKNFIIKSFYELFFNIFTFIKNYKKNDTFYIGADPLNALSGVFLKIFQYKFNFIYFTVDYSEKRFNNKIINYIYRKIDLLSIFFCDEVWNVSKRICDKRTEQGVPDNKIKLVPNTPSSNKIKVNNYNGNKNLVAITGLSDCFNLPLVINILKSISDDIKLYIIGDGPEKNNFIQKIKDEKLSNRVTFLGYMENKDALYFLNNCFIGFALYTNKNDFHRFADSTKAREYIAQGVPVIINDTLSNSIDILDYNLGVVVKDKDSIERSTEEVKNFITKCYDEKYYSNIRENCLKYSLENNKDKILKSIFKL